jgi:heterodisulfide reductase subunit D
MTADMSKFFRRIQAVKSLQVAPDDLPVIEQHTPPDRAYDLVLYLGCNILRTPHVAQTVVDVFEHLDLDFVAVGGSQYCCGVIWDRAGDVEGGQKVAGRTVGRLEDYGASTVVMWCPSYNVHFTDAIYGRDGTTTAFDTTHTPAFLLDLLEQGRLEWQREVPLRVALHSHVGRTDHPTGRERAATDRDTVSALLQAVPGVELAATVPSPPEFSFDCGPVATGMGAERFAAARQPMVDEARGLGIDALVTISHACQREWCDVAGADMDVVNYITLVAQALGLAPREDTLKRYKAGLAPADIVAAGRGAWTRHGIDESEALELASTYFGEGKQP